MVETLVHFGVEALVLAEDIHYKLVVLGMDRHQGLHIRFEFLLFSLAFLPFSRAQRRKTLNTVCFYVFPKNDTQRPQSTFVLQSLQQDVQS